VMNMTADVPILDGIFFDFLLAPLIR